MSLNVLGYPSHLLQRCHPLCGHEGSPYLSPVSDKFNDWGGRGCNIFIPVLEGNGTKIAPTVEIFDQPPGQMR